MLVLGAVRIFQPVHGYDVRRELLSWRLEGWINVQPGSIYSSLKTLERDGLISITGHEKSDGRPERTEYATTQEGEKSFQQMLRKAWWQVERGTEPLIAALCLLPFMARDELIAALQARLNQLEGETTEIRFARGYIRDGATGADGDVPEHVREIMDFAAMRLKADIDWTRQFVRRLKDGAYTFANDTKDIGDLIE